MSKSEQSKNKRRKRYQKPKLRKHNDLAKTAQQFSAGAPPGGASAAAQASPVVPGATVF